MHLSGISDTCRQRLCKGGKDQGLVGATEGMEAALGLSGATGLAQHTSTPWILESQCWEGPRGCDQLSFVSKG